MNQNKRGNSTRPYRRAEHGFAILEALVALAVVAFGMMAIAAFQFTLARASDVAKQRTEATRIAQREIDRLRSFGQRTAYAVANPDRLTFIGDIGVGTVNLPDETGAGTNTTFRTARVITAPTAPLPVIGENYRWVNVVVSWDDRTGTGQSVQLSTAITDGSPSDLGGLASGNVIATTLKPKNRNINIPYPAVNLAGGVTSAFAVPPNNVVFIFDNVTGRVIGRCVVAAPTEGATLTPTSSGCATADAYILSGYVRFKTTGAAADRDNIDDPTQDLTDPTRPLLPTVLTGTVTQPLTITSSATGNAPSGVECYAQEQATLRNNAGFEVNVAIDPATGSPYVSPDPLAPPAGFSFTGNPPRFIAYTCIVTPIDHDSNVSTPKIWSGEVTLNAQAAGGRGWNIGTTGTDYKVCRFSSDYNRNNTLSNSEHPRYYRGASGPLDNQNFLVLLISRPWNRDPH